MPGNAEPYPDALTVEETAEFTQGRSLGYLGAMRIRATAQALEDAIELAARAEARAAELEADAARYRALVALAEQTRAYMDDDCMYAGALLQPSREDGGTWVATQFVVQRVVPVAACVARFVGDIAGLGATAADAIDSMKDGEQDQDE